MFWWLFGDKYFCYRILVTFQFKFISKNLSNKFSVIKDLFSTSVLDK